MSNAIFSIGLDVAAAQTAFPVMHRVTGRVRRRSGRCDHPCRPHRAHCRHHTEDRPTGVIEDEVPGHRGE